MELAAMAIGPALWLYANALSCHCVGGYHVTTRLNGNLVG